MLRQLVRRERRAETSQIYAVQPGSNGLKVVGDAHQPPFHLCRMADAIDIFSKTNADDAAAFHRDDRFQIIGRRPTAAPNI